LVSFDCIVAERNIMAKARFMRGWGSLLMSRDVTVSLLMSRDVTVSLLLLCSEMLGMFISIKDDRVCDL
jgi:hypothetical protein